MKKYLLVLCFLFLYSIGYSDFVSRSTFTQTGKWINLNADKITWGDGTIQISSPSNSGSGTAILTATQTWTGQNSFNNLITISSAINFNGYKMYKSGTGIYTDGDFTVLSGGSYYYGSQNLDDRYLGISATSANSDKLDNQHGSYYSVYNDVQTATTTLNNNFSNYVTLSGTQTLTGQTTFYNHSLAVIYPTAVSTVENLLLDIGPNSTGSTDYGAKIYGYYDGTLDRGLRIKSKWNTILTTLEFATSRIGILNDNPSYTFDVGGQLTTNNYAIRTSSAIIGVSRIEWADGTVQVSSGSNGNVYLSSTQTFTGENSFYKTNHSTVQIGGTPALTGYTLSNNGKSLFSDSVYIRTPNGLQISSGGVSNILAINSTADGTQNTNFTIPDAATLFIKNASDNDQLGLTTKGLLTVSSITITGNISGTNFANYNNVQLSTAGLRTDLITLQISTGTLLHKVNMNIPVYSVKLDTFSFCRIDASENNWRLLFSSSVAENGTWEGVFDSNYLGGVLYADIYYTMTSATSGGVTWDMSIMAVTPDDSADINTLSYDTVNSSNTNVPGTAGYLKKATITLTNKDNLTSNDWYKIKLSRNVDDAGDTAISNAEVVGIKIRE